MIGWLWMLGCTCASPPGTADDGGDPEDTPTEPSGPPPSGPLPTGPLPIFERPFQGEFALTNAFDHGSDQKDRALSASGTLTWGLKGHLAYDYGMPIGTDLFATAAGTVIKAGDLGPKRCTGGNRVPDNVQLWIAHDEAPDGNVYISEYRHLSTVSVAKGDRVVAGQPVAKSGNTGCSSGPHLHFEVLRVTDRNGWDGYPVDPFGWRGATPEPRGARGRPSVWMWKDGAAPPARRLAQGRDNHGAMLGPNRMVGLDLADPIGGEFVDISLRRDAPRSQSLSGFSVRNVRGEAFALPDVTLAPGGSFRVWSRRTPGANEASWGRTTEAWEDIGDCAILVDPRGKILSVLPFGRGGGRCPAVGGR